MNIKKIIPFFKIVIPLVLLTCILASLYMPALAAPSGERLRSLAGQFLIGYASRDNFGGLSDAAIYQETARTEFNFLTPENAMKWGNIHPQQSAYSFTGADQQVQFAQANNMEVHGHTLVWHSQLPNWVSNGSWTESSLTSVMYDHIDTVMGRYQGHIAAWDVVNEAFNEDGSYRTSVFYNTIGQKYIELAFQRARSADPNAKLIYNDYNIEALGSKSNAVYNMLADFVNRGVPVDGVGFQMHLTSGGINYSSLSSNMQRFADLGLEIYITEMDVRYATPISQTDLNNQATIYRNVLNRCLLQPACKALQIWGFTDKYSWIPEVFSGQGDALIFDSNYAPKPAYYALQAELIANPRATATPCVNCTPTQTSTIAPPTNTSVPPTSTNTPVSGALKVQMIGGGTDNSQQSAFHYRVQNTGTNAVSNVSVRLYFTLDGSQPASSYVLEKYYDQSGAATVSGPTQLSGSTYYFTVNYGSASLAAGSAWEFHTAMHLNNWSQNYSSGNDWWRAAGTMPSSYTDWTNIPAYLSGSLNWGNEPGDGPTHTPTATGTITRTPTATPSASRTPTPTTCPMATAEPLRVEPVISPSDQTTQVITVRANNSDSVTVALESGSFTVTGDFSTSNPALVTVSLLPNTEHHLTVSAHIKTFVGPGGCTYGGYTLLTENDRYGIPLTIIQSDGAEPTFTPTPTITPTHTPTRHPGAACAVTYSMNDWGSGFTANVTIANNGSTAINGWTLAWAFPGSQTITNLWSGSYTQSGQSVSVTNLGYNANIPPNGNVNFGFNANYSGANARPTVFNLNGSPCSINP